MSNLESGRVPDWWKPYQEQFPGWRVWRGNDYRELYYARLPGTLPLVVVHASTPARLRDQILEEALKRSQEGKE